MSRALILLAVTALGCHDKDPPRPAPAVPPAPSAASVSPTTATVAGERPELPMFGSAAAGSGASVAEAFAAEPVDSAWKARTESELRARFARMKHAPAAAECHTSLCKLTIAGSEADVGATVDELQALHDQAQRLLLSAPVKDGEAMTMTAYLLFDR